MMTFKLNQCLNVRLITFVCVLGESYMVVGMIMKSSKEFPFRNVK
jgi:hypothetical protein